MFSDTVEERMRKLAIEKLRLESKVCQGDVITYKDATLDKDAKIDENQEEDLSQDDVQRLFRSVATEKKTTKIKLRLG